MTAICENVHEHFHKGYKVYLIESQAWGVSKRVQVNVSSDAMVKDEGSVAARNGHLAKRSPQVVEGGTAVAGTGTVVTGTAVTGTAAASALSPAEEILVLKKLTKIVAPAVKKIYLPAFKKVYLPLLKKISPFYVKKLGPFPFLGVKAVKSTLVVPVGTILGAATIGGGAIGAGVLGTATLGAGALGAGVLGAGALGTAAVAGTAGVAGMWCVTKTYSNFILCQRSNITVEADNEQISSIFLTRWLMLFAAPYSLSI